MRTILILIFAVIFANFFFAQDLRKKAEENPLNCAFYLLWQEKADNEDDFEKNY